jgi:hypothetical protein
MRVILLAFIISSCSANFAHADDRALAPGKPAGITNAQMVRDPAFYIVFGIGLIGTGIAIAASTNRAAITTSTTTTIATTP